MLSLERCRSVYVDLIDLVPKIGVDTAENEPSEVWPACLPAPDPPAWVELNSHVDYVFLTFF